MISDTVGATAMPTALAAYMRVPIWTIRRVPNTSEPAPAQTPIRSGRAAVDATTTPTRTGDAPLAVASRGMMGTTAVTDAFRLAAVRNTGQSDGVLEASRCPLTSAILHGEGENVAMAIRDVDFRMRLGVSSALDV